MDVTPMIQQQKHNQWSLTITSDNNKLSALQRGQRLIQDLHEREERSLASPYQQRRFSPRFDEPGGFATVDSASAADKTFYRTPHTVYIGLVYQVCTYLCISVLHTNIPCIRVCIRVLVKCVHTHTKSGKWATNECLAVCRTYSNTRFD